MNKGILRMLLKRFLSSLIILFLLLSFVFILLRIAPGDVTQKFYSPKLRPELRAKIIESFNLNKSIPEQYSAFLTNLLSGNLGISYNHKLPVTEVVSQYFPFTFVFTIAAFLMQIIVGILLSLFAIKRMNTSADKIISGSALLIYSVPSFVAGVSLIYIFSNLLKWFPSSGLISFDHYEYSWLGRLSDYAKHLVLPLITLSFSGAAIFYKYMRESLEDVYNQSFVLNLRAGGFKENNILLKHAMPNALNPLISVAGVELGILFSGALITEMIFGLPGMGRLSVNAILTRDYPLIVGCTLVVGLAVLASNFLADVVKALVDKRLVKEIIG